MFGKLMLHLGSKRMRRTFLTSEPPESGDFCKPSVMVADDKMAASHFALRE